MADFIEEKKKQKQLIYILAFVLLITAFVLWYGFGSQSTPQPEVQKAPLELEFETLVEIDLSQLQNPILKELESFEEIQPFDQESGRQNPFLPF